MAAALALVLIYSLARVLGMEVADAVLIEILFFDQRKISVALHLSQRLLSRLVLFCSALVQLVLADSSHSRESAHHAHMALHTWRVHQRLSLSELAESGSLVTFHHVTVIGEVRIVGASLVLQRLDRRSEVNFALEKLFALNLVQFLRLVSVGLRHAVIQGAHGNVLYLCAHL